jgi:hypothetical protein
MKLVISLPSMIIIILYHLLCRYNNIFSFILLRIQFKKMSLHY